MQKYLINPAFESAVEFLEQLAEAREKSAAVDQKILEAAKECELDPEKLKVDVQAFLKKRLNLGSIFDRKEEPKPKPRHKEQEHDCQICTKTKNFMM